MADQNLPALPPIDSSSEPSQQGSSQIKIPNFPDLLVGPTSKDVMIGGGALLVLTIVFFLIRISFVNFLIGPSMKRSPNNAGMAGWGLFGGLFFGGSIGCAALVSKTFMMMPMIISLSALSLICFAIALVVASKK